MLEDPISILCWRHHKTRTCCSGYIYSQHENLKGWALHSISEAACSTYCLTVLRVNKQILSENLSRFNICLLSVVFLPCRAWPHPPSDFPAGTGILPSKWRPAFFLSVYSTTVPLSLSGCNPNHLLSWGTFLNFRLSFWWSNCVLILWCLLPILHLGSKWKVWNEKDSSFSHIWLSVNKKKKKRKKHLTYMKKSMPAPT